MESYILRDVMPFSSLIFDKHFGRNWRNVPPKRRLTFSGLHSVVFPKIELILHSKNFPVLLF
jgi:hypothetical protein